MKKTILLLFTLCVLGISHSFAQSESGTNKMLITGHTTVTATLDSGQSQISNANFSAIFLYKLSEKLFVESEIEIETGGGSPDIGLEHANLVWMIGNNITFHAGRFVPHFGLYRGRLGEGFISRFASDPVGFGDGGIGTMEAVGFGFQGGFAAGVSKFNYDLWLSNGPQLKTGIDAETGENLAGQFDYEAYTDNNKNKALGGRIGFLPLSNSSLEIGFSFEHAAKTESPSDNLTKSVGVTATAFDLNFYHKVDAIKSTIRLTGEYKMQNVDKYDYVIDSMTTLSFDNKSSCYYGSLSFRPTGSANTILRNFELAFRYSQFKTPDGAPWGGYMDGDGVKHIKMSQTAVALNYWLKWNCVAKLCYQKQDGVTDQFFVQLYYGF